MKENTPLPYISLVAIVALVAVVIIVMDYNVPVQDPGLVVDEEGNIAGQATKYRVPAFQTAKPITKYKLAVLFEYNCEDGIDNDGDNKIDCQDESCMNTTFCFGQENNNTNTSDVVTLKEQGCIDSGGEISKMLCYCSGVDDYPDTCMVGVCTCSPDPEYEKEIKACFCPDNECFNGSMCIRQAY